MQTQTCRRHTHRPIESAPRPAGSLKVCCVALYDRLLMLVKWRLAKSVRRWRSIDRSKWTDLVCFAPLLTQWEASSDKEMTLPGAAGAFIAVLLEQAAWRSLGSAALRAAWRCQLVLQVSFMKGAVWSSGTRPSFRPTEAVVRYRCDRNPTDRRLSKSRRIPPTQSIPVKR